MRKWALSLLGLTALVVLSGCASTPCNIKPATPGVDLKACRTICVKEATAADGVVVPTHILSQATSAVVSRLQASGKFDAVYTHPCPAGEKPTHVAMLYTSYRPGSRTLRWLLIGLGTADLKMNVQLAAGADGQTLGEGNVHEYWGWGGWLGMSRGIEEMQDTAWRHVADGIIQACTAP